jgi:hypothetical protein
MKDSEIGGNNGYCCDDHIKNAENASLKVILLYSIIQKNVLMKLL